MKYIIDMSTSNSSAPTTTTTSPKQRPTRPPPIDINLAQQMRALSLLPRSRTSTSSSSSSSIASSSISPLGSPKRTPLYVSIYAQMRSPASSTPFPSIMTPPAKAPPITAICHPATTSTPLSSSSSSSAYTGSFYSPLSATQNSPKTSLRRPHSQASHFLFARSRRMEMLRKILVDPIETDTRYLGTTPKWYRMRTPIYGRWYLFHRPSQLRLARLAEDAWYGLEEEKSPDTLGGYGDKGGTGVDDEGMLSAREDRDGSADGWRRLPAPISPFEDDLRRVAAGQMW